MLEAWSKETKNTIWVGDSDQTLFRFSGAVPETFRDLKHDWKKILPQSYRVPPAVHAFAQKIIRRIKDREEVEYEPRRDRGEGSVEFLPLPDLSNDGDHMILARCNYQIKRWKNFLLSEKRVWHNPYRAGDKGWNPIHTKGFRALMTYFRLQRFSSVTLPELQNMAKEMRATGNLRRGAKKIIEAAEEPLSLDIFDLPPLGFTEELLSFKKPLLEVFNFKPDSILRSMLDRGYTEADLTSKPIILGTVHSVKGGESDNVWIDTTGHSRMHSATMDDELRVAYVAITRAKQNVGLLHPVGLKNMIYFL